jgi:TonB family protein
LVLVAALFVTGDFITHNVHQKYIGWEGQLELLPHITIIPGDDPYEDTHEPTEVQTKALRDVSVLEETGPTEGPAVKQPLTQEPERPTFTSEDVDQIRHYPAHTQVPYSENYVLLYFVQPEYPPAEWLQDIEGDVTVEVLVDEEGRVENVWVVSAVGPQSFEQSSLAAVRQFLFKPPMTDGKPVEMWIKFKIAFRLPE